MPIYQVAPVTNTFLIHIDSHLKVFRSPHSYAIQDELTGDPGAWFTLFFFDQLTKWH